MLQVMRRLRSWILLLMAFSAALEFLPAPLVWRPGEGWVDESSGTAASASSSREALENGKALEAKQEWDGALAAYRGLVRKWPLSFFAAEAQYKMGVLLIKKGKFLDAFKAFQKMVEKYPSSTFFEQALEQQYQIANLYLAGEPQRLLGIPMGSSMDKTVEMYEQLIKNAPYGKYAPEAQFKIGLAREKQKKFTDAVKAYNVILDKYPGHDIVDDAQYQIGYSWMMASSEAEYDQSAAQKAIESFQDFLVRYPNSEKVAAAEDNIARLLGKQTQGSLNIAQFYEKNKNYKAAFIYYNEVIRQSPVGPTSDMAKKKVEELRPLVDAESAKASGKPVEKEKKEETLAPLTTVPSTP